MEKNRSIAISHSGFYQRIINKYQKGKRNPFRFPVMLFYRHIADSVSRKIMMNILLQLHFYNRNIVSSFIVKSVHHITKMLPLIQDKTALGIPPAVHELVNRVSLVRPRQSIFSWLRNLSLILKKGIQRLFPITNANFYSRAAWNASAPGFTVTVNRQFFNYGNYKQIIKSLIKGIKRTDLPGNVSCYFPTQKNNARSHHFELEYRTPTPLSQNMSLRAKRSNLRESWAQSPLRRDRFIPGSILSVAKGFLAMTSPHDKSQIGLLPSNKGTSRTWMFGNTNSHLLTQKGNLKDDHFVSEYRANVPRINLLLNNSFANRTFQNGMTIHKPVIEHYRNHTGSDVANSETIQRNILFNPGSEHFYFRRQRKINQEIEEIKKIVVETKEAVADRSQASYPSIDLEIKKHLDINHLSDQVYQLIDRKIKIETERKGLL